MVPTAIVGTVMGLRADAAGVDKQSARTANWVISWIVLAFFLLAAALGVRALAAYGRRVGFDAGPAP